MVVLPLSAVESLPRLENVAATTATTKSSKRVAFADVELGARPDQQQSSSAGSCSPATAAAAAGAAPAAAAAAAAGVDQAGPAAAAAAAPSAAQPLRQLRFGHAEDKGRRRAMEDATVIAAPLHREQAPTASLFALFDGHNGRHAAAFAQRHILDTVTSSCHFPADLSAAIADAFIQIDQQYFAAVSGQAGESAGTTALAAVVQGNTLYVANAGDSRAVLSRSGRAVQLSRDHKPLEPGEKERIQASGGFVCGMGMLCGELAVARAIGDYHLPHLKQHGAAGPLTAEPEVTQTELTEADEFMLLACDGLWDVFPSQRAVEFARSRLREHNDPQLCAEELVAEALRMHSSDNVTAICCCFGPDPPPRRVFGGSSRLGVGRSVSREGLSSLAALLGEQRLA